MKISLSWIKDYVEIDVSLPLLIDKLNIIGLMVEDWEDKDGDIILNIETYANRPDTLGHLGVAREIAAGFGLTLKQKDWPITEISQKTSDLVDIQILDEMLCPILRDSCQKYFHSSLSRMVEKEIEAMGLKPINNVVDITNYVMFSTSHPIHAFDLTKSRQESHYPQIKEGGEFEKPGRQGSSPDSRNACYCR